MYNEKKQTKAIKQLLKSNNLFISRNDSGDYILSDGYVLIKVSPHTYKNVIMPVSGIFRELENHHTITKTNGATTTEDKPDYMDLDAVITSTKNDAEKVELLPYIYTGNKKYNMNIFIHEDGRKTFVNSNLFEIVEPFAVLDEWENKDGQTAVISIYEDMAAVILPVRMDEMKYNITTGSPENSNNLNKELKELKEELIEKNNKIDELSYTIEILRTEKEEITEDHAEEESKEEYTEEIANVQNNWIKEKAANLQAVAMDEAETENGLPHSIRVGDILSSSWGYEQTNLSFYQVTKLNGSKYITVKEVYLQPKESTPVSAMSEDVSYKLPKDGGIVIDAQGKPMRRMVQTNGDNEYISINSYANAYKYNGEILYRSWYC